MSKRILTKDEAKAIVKPGDRVHTFRCPGGPMLVGCDWDRADIDKAIDANATELAGKIAMGMSHGLCVHVGGPLFVETVENPEDVLKTLSQQRSRNPDSHSIVEER